MSRMVRRLVLAVVLGIGAGILGAPSTAAAQATLRVPADFPSIQAAVDAASPGDTVLVGSGTWCGAVIAKRLVVRGDGAATITGDGCSAPLAAMPAPAPGEIPIAGLLLQPSGADDPGGTVIEHLAFEDVYTAINASATNDVVVQHNVITPQRVGVFSRNGSNWTVAYNTFDNSSALQPYRNSGIVNQNGSGWTVVHNDVGSAYIGITMTRGGSLPPRPANNTVSFNHIDGGIDGEGIGLVGQDGAVVTNNDMFVPTSAEYQDSTLCGGWGITNWYAGTASKFLTSINSTIVNNNTRDTHVGVYVVLDPTGNPGNAEGLLLRGNLGTLALNQPNSCVLGETGVEKSRSIFTLIECDDSGECQ